MRAKLGLACLILSFACGAARAIDFYEIQIYDVSTTPKGHLQAELHSNAALSAAGAQAQGNLNVDQVHETLELTYGIADHVEVGQYLATAFPESGGYQYAGSRTKLHFGGFGDPRTSVVAFGGNIEVDYMRQAFEENPLNLELRPILEKRFGRLDLVFDAALEKPFDGPGPLGLDFSPSGLVGYDLTPWLTPALEYYGDLGAFGRMPAAQTQQHFLFPVLNFHLLPQLELNFGAGFGLTDAVRGVLLKSIFGWEF